MTPAQIRVGAIHHLDVRGPTGDESAEVLAANMAAVETRTAQRLVKCNTCTHHTPRGGCSNPAQDWGRESEPDQAGRPWCHSDHGSPSDASASAAIPAPQAGNPSTPSGPGCGTPSVGAGLRDAAGQES